MRSSSAASQPAVEYWRAKRPPPQPARGSMSNSNAATRRPPPPLSAPCAPRAPWPPPPSVRRPRFAVAVSSRSQRARDSSFDA